MYLDLDLKLEVLSLFLGQIVKPFDEKKLQKKKSLFLPVENFLTNSIFFQHSPYVKEFFIDEEEFFDPQYDYDFTKLSDSSVCIRGGELYTRPKGWYRMALKVRGKYLDGDAWLGTDGWRSHSVSGEWPVSYHGTSLDGAKGIIRSHYKVGKGESYGRGIYSTPDVHVAEREEYSKTFRSKTTGKNYKVILQNRINPDALVKRSKKDYWLIPVPKGASCEEEKCIVESAIRPYGILIKKINL